MRAGKRNAGSTLLEVLVAMMIMATVATGIITAFIFSRKVSWRSSTELSGAGLVTETADSLRGAVAGPMANGLTLEPGIYVDNGMPNRPAGAVTLPVGGGGPNPLNFPADFLRFQDPASGVGGATVARANHGDGRLVVVENAGQDLDGDGFSGVSFDGGTTTALRRVRVRVKFTSPQP